MQPPDAAPPRDRGGSAPGARLFAAATAFLAGVAFARLVHPALLVDPAPSWRLWRALLWLALLAVVALAGRAALLLFESFARSEAGSRPEAPLPFGRGALVTLAAAAFAAGALLRFAGLETVPFPLWVDDVSLVPAALALKGAPPDFADSIRPAPFGVPKPFGSVGVLYLELSRLSLLLWDTTVLGVRFPSAAAGALSLATAGLLGRALLPAGGGALSLLVLAGLRWHLVLSRWAWNAIVLAPVTDLAALALLRARSARGRRATLLALSSGLLAGLAAHLYLAAFAAAAALLVLALWPGGAEPARAVRLRRAALFLAGFTVAAAPLFLLREGRTFGLFARTSQNLGADVRRARSAWPILDVSADALAAPWLVSDPVSRNDLPGRSRLGPVLGAALALALARALAHPRGELSAFLLAHSAAGLAAAVAGGGALHPNGYRFVYLAGPASVGVAAGLMALLAGTPRPRRRAAALALAGLVAISGSLAARDALEAWPRARETWSGTSGFFGEDTLLGRAAVRWGRLGEVRVDPALGHSRLQWENVARFAIVTRRERAEWFGAGGPLAARAAGRRTFRVAPPGTAPLPGERRVETLTDGFGKSWAVVLGSRGG